MYLRYREETITNTEQNFAFKQKVKVVQWFVPAPKVNISAEVGHYLFHGKDVSPDLGQWIDIPTAPAVAAAPVVTEEQQPLFK